MSVSFPTIAVIIPVYNRLQFLRQAVESALAQTAGSVEVIVVDDGSRVDPQPILAPCGDRVRLIRKANGGLASARNAGIAQARSEYLLFLDDDDFLEPTAIASLVEALAMVPEAKWAAGKFRYVDESGKPIAREHGCRYGSGDIYRQMIHQNLMGAPSTVMVAAAAVRDLGGFDENPSYWAAEDYDLWLSLAQRSVVAAAPGIVTNYRVHSAQMSSRTVEHAHALVAVLEKHRAMARPGCDNDFAEAIAREQLGLADEYYARNNMRAARELWNRAAAGGQLDRIGLWKRRGKSFVPTPLLGALRGAAQSFRSRKMSHAATRS